MAGEHLVTCIPVVRIRERIGIEVPLTGVGVPVAVDGPDIRVVCLLEPLRVNRIDSLYFIRDVKVSKQTTPILFFFETFTVTLAQGVPDAILDQ